MPQITKMASVQVEWSKTVNTCSAVERCWSDDYDDWSRVFNKSHWRAKFAGYFMLTYSLLFVGNYPSFNKVFMCSVTEEKRQNLMMSVFCSNTLILAPECCKCILRGPDFKIFPETCDFTTSFLLLHLLQSLCHLLKILVKTLWKWWGQ